MSSFYDLASLVMIPSGKKAGKVYSQKPLSTDGQLDFTRASTATRIGSDGKIEKTRTNLVIHSNTFSNWSFTSVSSVTASQSGYDGTNDAWLLTDSGASGSYAMFRNFNHTGVLTASIYAKAASTNEIRIDFFGNILPSVTVDLSDGSIIGGTSRIDATTTNVGNGWYRVTLTGNLSSSTYIRIGCNQVGTIYIQDSQVEPGLVATNVITTTTAAVSVGSVDNMPRLNYTPGSATSCPSLLLEPQRTNLITQSEYVDSWLKYNCTIENNAITSPEGVQNAHKIVENTSLGYHAVYLNNVFTADGTYKTASVFVKAAGRTFCAISTRGAFGSTDKTLIFNLTTGEWAVNGSGQNTGLEAEDFGDGWWRIVLNTNTTSAAYDGFIVGAAIDGSSWEDAEYTGDGTSGIYVYGAQLEAGSYATSYIPTFGATVTRVADAASKTGISGLIGQTEGTLFLELKPLEFAGTSRYLSIESSTNASSGWIGIFAAGPSTFRIYGDGFDSNFGGYSVGDKAKIALTYKNGIATNIYINGINKGSVTANTTGKNYSTLKLGHAIIGGVGAGEYNRCIIFSTALTDTQLADLTSIES